MNTDQSQSVFIRGIHDLPDQNGARLFLDRLAKEQPRAHQTLLKQPALLADVLALAAWSPLLATTIEQNPEYLAWLDLDNRYGLPRHVDERGRSATAGFCVIALGKLGSMELNYASDIDLVFLYSDEGTTAGSGERGEVTNREYFVKLSETIARI